jgi:hypothetical protein
MSKLSQEIENWLLKKVREENKELTLSDILTDNFMFGGSYVIDLIEQYYIEKISNG